MYDAILVRRRAIRRRCKGKGTSYLVSIVGRRSYRRCVEGGRWKDLAGTVVVTTLFQKFEVDAIYQNSEPAKEGEG